MLYTLSFLLSGLRLAYPVVGIELALIAYSVHTQLIGSRYISGNYQVQPLICHWFVARQDWGRG